MLAVNDTWTKLARESGDLAAGVGENLLEPNPAVPASRTSAPSSSTRACLAVLRGLRDSFSTEYTTQSGQEARWWSVVVVPLDRPEGGAVVTRADVTDLRRAELDVQRSRQELAHVGRVSTVGELTASLAHELYQPLTAIMTNAQAARRMLSAAPPDLSQVDAILSDIVNDDRRARDVIERLRDLLRKGELELAQVDLASTIRDVAALLRSEALVRQVSVALDLDGYPVIVLGDRVQLQQVMLNLLHNAMEAMADGRAHPTTVSVRCRRTDLRQGQGTPATRLGAGPGSGPRHGQRHRPGAGARRRRNRLRAVLHHEEGRHGNGALDRPIDRRISRRVDQGDEPRARRGALRVHLAAGAADED